MSATDLNEPAAPLPKGFVPLPVLSESGFDSLIGSFSIRDDDNRLVAGFRIEPRHCNHAGTCHGGMLATICDGYLATTAMYENNLQVPILPTISLTVDFLAPGPIGAWVEFRADVLRVTRNTVFVQGIGRIDGNPVVRTSAVFKRPPPDPEGFDTGAKLRDFLRKPT
ncbi:PaaI family thioesterase [Acetobacter oeni]|uniref:Putative esterase n=1 Tax=Acetobacter oeni TaxID=304077 RepID=A0A511XLQ1_9PROT|nr:PaaI family thioesterase [Acetobacter oeni]MBB3884319.1 uncharacterized protein (TIGR00369 family) [Acetobacter oeni]NHO20235.1 hotdog fold thioesterase [Acetobacter oeni]GBR07608.1 hypothetical protein AA21952_2386 [Acetobacter oeni LMG 21952]GEN63873.1 putative esterase [Acetobacter oeni]